MICLTGSGAGLAHAVAGDPDPAFGTGGNAVPAITGADNVTVTALAIQDDGKIVGVGTHNTIVDGNDFMVFRLLPNGDLDTGFGSGGWAVTDIGFSGAPEDVVIQSDGKIVVAGTAYPVTGHRGALVRYNAGGSLDNGFGANGIVTMSSSYNSAWVAVTLQADGKIVVAGLKDQKCAVARFTTTGALDDSFGSNGIASLATAGASIAHDLIVDGDNRVVVAGNVTNAVTGNDFLVARFNSDGSLHTSFGSSGVLSLDFISNSDDVAMGLALDASGRIVLGGESEHTGLGSYQLATLVRLTSGGALDSAFGSLGKAYFAAENPMDTVGLALDPLGRPVLTGRFAFIGSGPYDGQSWLLRFTADGAIDRGFGTEGLKTVSHGAQCDFYGGVFLDARDRLLCVGESDDQGMVTRHQSDDHSSWKNATWWWSDPERNDTYLLDANLVTIKAQAMQDIWNCERRQAPMFVRNLPGGEHWTMEATIQVPDLKQDTFAGLVLWNGAEDGSAVYALYVGLKNWLDTTQVTVQGSIPELCSKQGQYDDYYATGVGLKIVRAGNDYTFYYAQIVDSWTYLDTVTTTAEFSKVGFLAKTWHASNEIEANFSYFSMILPGAASCLDLLLPE